MISVVQLDMSAMVKQNQDREQVMQAGDYGSQGEAQDQRIRLVTREALKTAESKGLKSLLVPVINSKVREISTGTIASLMVSEVRRYLSLDSDIQEVTFALPDEEGVQAFNNVVKRQQIVCLGDSITYGYPDGPEYSWVTIVMRSTGYQMINRGVSGETTGEMLHRFAKDVITERPAYLIFGGGHNDGWRGVPVTEAQENIKTVVSRALENGICPILIIPSPLNIEQVLQCYQGTRREAEEYDSKLMQIRNWIKQYAAEQGILTLDFYTPLLDPSGKVGDTKYLLDGGHPTHVGYRLLAEQVLKQLTGRLHV